MGQQSTDQGPEFLKSRLAQRHWELVAEPEQESESLNSQTNACPTTACGCHGHWKTVPAPAPVGRDRKHGIRVTAAYLKISPLSVFEQIHCSCSHYQDRNFPGDGQEENEKDSRKLCIGDNFFFFLNFKLIGSCLFLLCILSDYQMQLIYATFSNWHSNGSTRGK